MAAGYRISARPETKDGMLAGVNFVAESQHARHEWFTRNCGQFPQVFARVMPRELARLLVASLAAGDRVEFPGCYSEDEFDREFAFEWSAVNFLRPPVFAGGGQY